MKLKYKHFSTLNWRIFDPRIYICKFLNFKYIRYTHTHTEKYALYGEEARVPRCSPFIIKYARVRTKGARTLAAITVPSGIYKR